MTIMLFYQRAVALDRERHQNLKLALNADHFAFASATNSVLLAGIEFVEALRDYPIVFVGKEGGPFTAAALVGLAADSNLMVDSAGQWEPGTYIPAFIRRYPFVLAGADDAESLTVCIDEAYTGLNEAHGEALFGAGRTATPYLDRMVDFLQQFHTEMKRTSVFADRLAQLGLLVNKAVTVERAGSQQLLEGFWVVDEARLNALDDATVLELVRSGFMTWITAHLISLGNVSRLAGRFGRVPAADMAAASGA